MDNKIKSMKKVIGYGILIIVPIVLVLSWWFAELKMSDSLSIFLIVLIGGIACFAYYNLFVYIERKRQEKNKNKPDPFAD